MAKTAPSTSVRVDLSGQAEDRSYDVLISEGILDALSSGEEVSLPKASSYFLVTDSNVERLYGRALKEGLALARPTSRVELLSFRAGEDRKSLDTAWRLASEMSRLGADRGSIMLALGGGVVGDLTGFVASIYKRGIGYVQLPTSLLAQVDSSIGGKTGVDAPWGKNQLGTFHQPLSVMSDPSVLRTLPPGEVLNGVAEVVKCGIIADRELFYRASRFSRRLDSQVPVELIAGACRVKADAVSRDEKEMNFRATLNYGHTVGHAIESSSDYELGHGICVILGMIAEGWIAVHMGIMDREDLEEQSRVLIRLLESAKVRRLQPRLDKKTLLRFALADKKTTSSSLRMSLPERVGRMHTTKEGSYKVPVTAGDFMDSIDYLSALLTNSLKA